MLKKNTDQDHSTNFVKKYFQPLAVFLSLYPIQRIQSAKQIQTTFNKSAIKKAQNLFTICTHYGIRSWFRGFTPYFCRVSGLYLFMGLGNQLGSTIHRNQQKVNQFEKHDKYKGFSQSYRNLSTEIVKIGIVSAGYFLLYPFEILKIRMSTQIEQNTIYSSMNDCLRKIKKNEGRSLKTLYKGFSLSLTHLVLQYQCLQIFFDNLKVKGDKQMGIPLPSFLVSDSGIKEFCLAYLLTEILLYPLDSIRKLIQINGAIGHDNIYQNYRNVLQLHNKKHMYNGFSLKMFGGFLFYGSILGQRKYQKFVSNY